MPYQSKRQRQSKDASALRFENKLATADAAFHDSGASFEADDSGSACDDASTALDNRQLDAEADNEDLVQLEAHDADEELVSVDWEAQFHDLMREYMDAKAELKTIRSMMQLYRDQPQKWEKSYKKLSRHVRRHDQQVARRRRAGKGKQIKKPFASLGRVQKWRKQREAAELLSPPARVLPRYVPKEVALKLFMEFALTEVQYEAVRHCMAMEAAVKMPCMRTLRRMRQAIQMQAATFYHTVPDLKVKTRGSEEKLQCSENYICTDLSGLLTLFFITNQAAGPLTFSGPTGEEIWFTLNIDAGGNCTRMVVSCWNSELSNSPDQVCELGLYAGKDVRENLEAAFGDLFSQIDALTFLTIEGVDRNVVWFLCCDHKTLNEMMGVMPASSTCPCVRCAQEIWGLNMRDGVHARAQERTLEQIELSAREVAQAKARGFSKFRVTHLKQQLFSVFAAPLLKSIDISRLVPPPLHIILGVGELLIGILRAVADQFDVRAQVEERLSANGIVPTGNNVCKFNGNVIRRMFRSDTLNDVLSPLSVSDDRVRSLRVMHDSFSKIMSYFAARFLTNSEVKDMDDCVRLLMETWAAFRPEDSMTLKLHMLNAHVMEFVKKFGTLGKACEQGAESNHRLGNRIQHRYANRPLKERVTLEPQMKFARSSILNN